MRIAFVGISNKQHLEPFASSTLSGKIIDQIILKLPHDTCFKCNLVSYAPVNERGKLRYPTREEIVKELPHFWQEIEDSSIDLIISCGGIVTKVLQTSQKQIPYISVLHPSYVGVYHRKEMESYVCSTIREIDTFKENFVK